MNTKIREKTLTVFKHIFRQSGVAASRHQYDILTLNVLKAKKKKYIKIYIQKYSKID